MRAAPAPDAAHLHMMPVSPGILAFEGWLRGNTTQSALQGVVAVLFIGVALLHARKTRYADSSKDCARGTNTMLPPFNRALAMTVYVFWVGYGSFILGGYAVSFSGSKLAWFALVSCVLLVLLAGAFLLRFIWRTANNK
jgi:hypothetical protein